MKRDDFTLPLAFPGELIIDNFAGGGGTSTGLEAAFGRPVDIAINHDPQALAMHALNHPHTQHLCESVWEVDPIKVTRNQPVALVWLSPDCKHFSKAKGGTPVAKHIRGLAWVGMRWAAKCKPRVLMLENVEEFQDWGPLIIDAGGNARPCPRRKGKTFESFVRQLRGLGYTVDWRELRACDYGAPTIRKRLFLIARRDGLPIVWPEASHGEPTSRAVLAGKQAAHRSAAECIDFDLPAESVFGRKKPLVPNTMRRVAKGLWRHVLTSASPFIVGVGGRMGQSPERSVRAPMQTITSKADSCVAMPILAALRGTSEQHLGGHDVGAPLSTISAGGTHHALAGAHLITIGYGEREGQAARAQDLSLPLGTVVAGGVKSALVAAYLVKYYSEGGQDSACNEPMHTVPTKARMGLVQTQQVPAALLSDEHRERARLCAELLHQHLPEHFPEPAALVLMWHAEQWWVLVDITLRMLKPRELYRAQGFPEGYQITEIPDPALLFIDGQQAGHPLALPRVPLTATAQVRMCGNSVSPPVAEALVSANFAHEAMIYGVTAA
ncbi:DNA cytosine methyltransferase [Comamonas antarctica]|uniref:DNA (cytosine-5-)-methyltransferase n=1 Tax=Comamonas antarctica TaxID=2743470 RepID=A0A6N1X2U2_9BURK|nr:DNA cytosine methyltransferase [Comamonas antarctica]QKV52362.1 DNA cytosine methyltransferase [Comamonas antarctica]